MDSLTNQERAMLDLETRWWQTAGGKERAIRELGMTPVRYYQLLSRLLGTEKAMAYAAVTVHRLQRVRRPSRDG
ncbi:hypothetical protein MMAD_18090 [Mycolicibacterium madagascariense]|uniref:DUF3263 domain-containing protein n=1 Tax=Mycolicibacterium madagascariense TaxID=212765 RepID=A0A7I7XD28_9MYCO|nr:DUF3263 domain-containing protein [Mycolicibacterium madagascariense]MCV7015221.1 DUF3263 domain-containing protein [Mycolicibacterium madagascariense]BBZ27514.1 hypothetical protein MMAD_18090 [Mycolicibacterium madagascariense]